MKSVEWRRFILLLLLTNCVFVFLVRAQTVYPSFRHFTTENGLPSSEVYHVLQDQKGNLWFGTDRGATRFDGYEFRTFTYTDGLTDNTVFKLTEDKNGRLWLLTYSDRIFYLKDEKIYPYKYNDILYKAADSRVPYGFYIDSVENVYAAIRDYGEIKITNNGELQERFIRSNSPGINFIVNELSTEKILVSIISLGNKSKETKFIHQRNNVVDTFTVATTPAERFEVVRLSDDAIVFSIGKSLFMKNKSTVKHIADLPGKIFSVIKDNRQNVWVGTEDGVFLFDKIMTNYHSYHYLEHNNITCILQDHEGGYWFTTLNNGVYYLSGYGIKGIPFNQGLFQKPTSLATDFSTSVYVGSWNGSVIQISGGVTKIIYTPTLGTNFPVTTITAFPDDERIYISRSQPGYFSKGKFSLFKCDMYLGVKTNFMKRSDGEIYSAGTRFIFKNKKDSIIPYAIISERISCIAETNDNQLLLGSNQGVYIFDEKLKESKIFRKDLLNVRVDDIKCAGKLILFATKGKGVLILAKDSVIKIDESNGLCSNLVNKLLVAKNDVWCTTNKGISHIIFNNTDSLSYSITNIRSNDGLFNDEINDITLFNDTIYVATNSGISFFNAGTDFINHTNPPVYITSLHVNNSDTLFSDLMEFPHDNNNLQIGFNGISYRSNGKIKYHYTLISGADTLSSYTNNREVEFLSLHPGLYSFTVSAMNNSGVWSKTPAKFSFIINPAWWQTWWLKVLIILLIAAVAYVFYRNKVKSIKHEFDMVHRQASMQLTAMRAQMNPHFIFNVMSSIRNYMQDHDMKSAEKYLTSFSKLVRYVLDNSEVQEITLEEELNAIRNYVELEMQRFENGFEFNIICEEGINLSETTMLSLLLQPFVENSIKHGISRNKCRGKILIDIRKTPNSILIAIEDNGVGMEEALKWNEEHLERHASHGTTINLERIAAYNKVYNKNIKTRFINLTDNEGKSKGTRVEVEI